jgi:serine protease Do
VTPSRPSLVGIALAAAVAAVAACSGAARQAQESTPTRLTVKEIVERSKPAIVQILVFEQDADGKEQVTQAGTGFAVEPGGLIATNLHVIKGATDVRIKLFDGRTLTAKRVVAFDPVRDLALLDLALSQPMPFLPLGDSDGVAAGDPVVTIGNPLGVLDYTVSDGLISSIRPVPRDPQQPEQPDMTFLQISAPISQGSSGGPIFNDLGEVIGVAVGIFEAGQNLNFAVPANYLKPLLAERTPMTMSEFAVATADPRIERQVPHHELAVLDGCSVEQAAAVGAAIGEAIQVGAPIYNQGLRATSAGEATRYYEACFRIYERTSKVLEQDGPCRGVRAAFAAGLSRAAGLASYKEKAWALRDTFDGLLDVIRRRLSGEPPAP